MNPKLFLCLAVILGVLTMNGQNALPGPVPREVLAAYYPWYTVDRSGQTGMHWGNIAAAAHETSATVHYPARGVYNSMDPGVVRSQIELARSNGITGFIVSWWGRQSKQTRNDASVPLLLQCANEQHFKIAIYWEQEPGSKDEKKEQAVDDLVYIVTTYGTNDAFLKVDGKPVIFIYARVLSQIPKAAWPDIMSEAKAKAGPFLLLADGYDDFNARHFDGLYRYTVSWSGVNRTPDEIRAWAAQQDGDGVALARQYHRISCVTVSPGYDDTKQRKPGHVMDRQNGEAYRVHWEEAILAKPDWVLITSWNEWMEGTEIEPSVEDGDQYVKLTAKYAGQFLGTNP